MIYNHRKGIMQCTSFGHSIFALDGTVEKGPAKRSLRVFATRIRGGQLEIEL